MNNILKNKTFFIVFICLCLLGCKNLNNTQQINKKEKGVKISLSFGNSRQINPEKFSASNFELKGTHDDEESVWTYDSLAKLNSATLYIEEGDWSFTLSAYKNDELVASDTITKTISEESDDNILSFTYYVSKLNYETGYGNIDVTISFPTDKNISRVTAALYEMDDLENAIEGTELEWDYFPFDYSTEKYYLNYSRSFVTAGNFYLVYKFFQNGYEKEIGLWRDLVNIANGCTSSGSSEINDFNELFSITYNMNGISFKSGFVAPVTYNKSQFISLPTGRDMDETDLKFTGWYEEPDFSGDKVESWAYDERETDIVLYARNTATVYFDTNGFGDNINEQVIVYGETVTEPEKPEPTTKQFVAWYKDEELTERYDFSEPVENHKTLYAEWALYSSECDWYYPTSAPEVTWEGSGTATSPYIISTAQELADLAYMVNTYTSYSGQYFELIKDIDLNYGRNVTGDDNTLKNWIPIGNNSSYPFEGNFNGNYHKVKGLYINDSDLTYAGLFGIGSAYNITVENSYIKSEASYCGGIIGFATDIVTGCLNKATINSNNENSYAGGVVGYTNYSIINCRNYGEINGSYYIGGIVGYSASTISNCINHGEINGYNDSTGGIVGYSYYTINNCTNYGEINGSNYSGGIVGYSYGVTINNCTNNGDIYSNSNSGGIIGYNSSYSAIINKSANSGNITGDTAGGIIGKHEYNSYASSKLKINECQNDGIITSTTYGGGICGYVYTYYSGYFNVINCSNTGTIISSGTSGYFGGICGYSKGYSYSGTSYIRNCINKGKLKSINTNSKYFGGIVGYSTYYFGLYNCVSLGDYEYTTKTDYTDYVGGIIGDCYSSVYCYYSYYMPTESVTKLYGYNSPYEDSVGLVISKTSSITPTDSTSLSYTGTILEVLNAYVEDNNSDGSLCSWIEGDDGWPKLNY